MSSEMPAYQPPPAELQDRMKRKARISQGEVTGTLGGVNAMPDVFLYILDKRKDGPDKVWEVDAYCIRDGTNGQEYWKLHMLCPVCGKCLTLESSKKQMQVRTEGEQGRRVVTSIEVEPFGCSWDGDFGQLRCTFRAAIRPPKDKDEAIVRCDQDPTKPFRMHGVFARD